MAQAGFTPIQLYYSASAAAAPTAGNLASGELAINIADGKLFYKDNLNAVQVIAWKNVPLNTVTGTLPVANGGTGQTSYTDGQLLIGNSSGNTLTKATLTAGSGVSITNGNGSITIAATGGGMVYPGAGIPNSTGSAWGTSYSTTGGSTVVRLARYPVNVISTNTAAAAYNFYVFTAALTLTLPATPTAGDWVQINNSSNDATCVIARNGENIQSLAEDLTVDSLTASFTLIYADATRGWVLAI